MKNLKPKTIKKQSYKHTRKCRICGEKDYDLLDVHRIKAGAEGGRYIVYNTVCLCVVCHRYLHKDRIKILGWKMSTVGELLHIINLKGEEDFI